MTTDNIKIITVASNRDVLRNLIYPGFEILKVVVDIEKKIMAVGGELHADEEAVLLESGSKQESLWGINLYLDKVGSEMIEFNSMINIRPSQNNRSRDVEDLGIRKQIVEIVHQLVT